MTTKSARFGIEVIAFIIAMLLLIFASTHAPAQTAPTAFKTYTDPNSKFTIDFPGDPAVSKPVENKGGKQPFTEFHLTANDDQSYALLITDYTTDQTNVDVESLAVGAAQACGGGYIVEDHEPWEGHKAAIISLDCPANNSRDEMYAMIHVVIDGSRIYQAMVGVTEAQSKAADTVTRGIGFLKSIHLKAAK